LPHCKPCTVPFFLCVTHEAEWITCITVATSSDASPVTLDAAKVCVAELASIDRGTATQIIISGSCVAQRKIGTVQGVKQHGILKDGLMK
jgi:hypothetical protein